MENVLNVRNYLTTISKKKGIIMKKNLLGISLLATSMLLNGCATSTPQETPVETTESNTVDDDVLHIVASSFHEYDWLTQVIGDQIDRFDITLLIDNGVDMHSYEPTVEDIATITDSDLFIYNGGESDTWAENILKANPDLNTINVVETLGDKVKNEVLIDGMEAHDHDHDHDEAHDEEHNHEHDEDCEEDHHHEHDEDCEEDHHHEHDEDCEEDHHHEHDEDCEDGSCENEVDEHIWLSLNNAMLVCDAFADELAEIDSTNADAYHTNTEAYIDQLKALDTKYTEVVETSPKDTIIVTDRFPFLYLANDYNINYYAAFVGCSAETEASFETIAFLSEKIKEYDVNNVIILEDGLENLANTVVANSGNSDIETLTLDSMQSITQEDIDAGTTYLSIMESNLNTLKLALAE